MHTDHLATLAAVERMGSLTAAADNLGIAQSTASRRVRMLELHFGVPLLDRSRGPATLTGDGEAVARAAPAILAAVASAEAAAAGC